MSILLPHSYFPRSLYDMNQWHKPLDSGMTTTDLFDPFDELDHMIGKNFYWLNKPEFMTHWPTVPKFPQKYRVVLDCLGFDPKSLKVECHGRKLVVNGREEHKLSQDDYSKKEFKKSYDLPQNCELDKLVSFVTPNGHLIIEMPVKESTCSLNADLFPKIVDTAGGGKLLSMRITVPEHIKPSHVHVMIKDRDLIIKAEDKVDKPDGCTRFFFYKRSTLPENTDFNSLRCNYDQGKLLVEAPLKLEFNVKHIKNIPIGQEWKK